ncbi:MAG: hypothetical protein E7399_04520 [Ruminococcaceae bacterium]|nr:hypothetical protein [Oscillospiraceae bacterium]
MMKSGKKVLLLCLCLTLLFGTMTAVQAGEEEPILVQSNTPLYNTFLSQSEANLWANGTRSIVTEAGADGTAMKVTGLAKGTRLQPPAINWRKNGLYTVTGRIKASEATTLEICLNLGVFIYQSTNGGTPFNYQYPNARINVGTDWTEFTFTVEIFDYVTSKEDSTPTGVSSQSARLFLTPSVDVASNFTLFVDNFEIQEDITLYSGEKNRVVIYEEDFEEGLGSFVEKNDPVKLVQKTDGDNGYVAFMVDADRAEVYATYTHPASNPVWVNKDEDGGWQGGRWGREFMTGRFEIKFPEPLTLSNGRNYKIEWLMAKEEAATGKRSDGQKSQINSAIFCTTDKNIFISSTAAAEKETYPGVTATGMIGKTGFYQYYNNLSSYQFGTKAADGTISGTATFNDWQIRTLFIEDIAKKMATDKLYCGKGTGLYNSSGALQSAQPWGKGYTFTLDRSDFYGDETIGKGGTPLFTEGMTEDEKNAVMDSYIYVDPDAETPVQKQYSLANDCSFLYSPTRLLKLKQYLDSYPYFFVMDDFKVTADAAIYKDEISITGEGSVTALTNPVTEESTTLTESGTVITNDYFGVTYTVTPAEGYAIESVTYDGSAYTLDSNNQFTVEAEAVTEGKA